MTIMHQKLINVGLNQWKQFIKMLSKKQISLSSEDWVDISNENLNIELFLDERSGDMEQPRQQHPILIT